MINVAQHGAPDLSARWRTFAIAAAIALAAAAGFTAATIFHPFDAEVQADMDNLGQLFAAASGAAACAWAARQASGKERRGWALLGLSAGAWAIGQLIWTYYALLLDIPIPYPSAADFGFLTAVPLAFAGVMSFWTAPRGTATRWRVWLDGLIIALALTFTAWALGLRAVAASAIDSAHPLTDFLNFAYPIGDILIGTVLILAIRRATHQRQGRMLLLLGGLAANSLADSTFSYLTANNSYAAGDFIDAGWVIGYLMIALAALWPTSTIDVRSERAPVDLWQLALPWLTVLLGGLTAIAIAVSGHGLDVVTTTMVGASSILLTISVVTANRDSLAMLMKSRASEATLAEVIEGAPAGVARIATDLSIIDANPRFTELLGTDRASLIGDPMTRYFPGEEGRRFVERLQALKMGAVEAVESDSEAVRMDGSGVWVHWSTTVVRNASGESEYFIAMFEDTTSRHEAEAAASANLAMMQRLNGLKTEFLQGVSHEFKTALIGIQGFSELMRDADELDVKEIRGFAADIYSSAERLDRMVTEMLDLDRVESGRAHLRIAPVDLNDLVRREVRDAGKSSEAAPIDLDLDAAVRNVSGDEEKLSDVIRTLLENAMLSSPEGGHVRVTTAATRSGVDVSVRDDGVGVGADFDNRLFSRDDLYANNPIRKVVGTGLQLGIARQVVEMHGGRLWVLRAAGEGSEYHFTIPVTLAGRAVALAAPGAP